MDVSQGFSNHYPFADQNFGNILDPLQTNGGTFSKIYTVFPQFTAPARTIFNQMTSKSLGLFFLLNILPKYMYAVQEIISS